MNIQDLRETQATFEDQIGKILKERKELHKLRSSFVKYFNRKRVRTMKVEDYIIGLGRPENKFNFCYTLERELNGLGSIRGSTAFKFGIYFGKTTSDPKSKYRFTQKFGATYSEAFEGIKETILHLLNNGEKEDINAIAQNKLSSMFKAKILFVYFPERYLNIFSGDHLDYYLKLFNLDTTPLTTTHHNTYKREALLKFKNQDPIMKNWSVDLFSTFLYRTFPPPSLREKSTVKNRSHLLVDYRIPNFPSNPKVSGMDLTILPIKPSRGVSKGKNNKRTNKPDYEKEARILKKLGDRGEKIVMDFEVERLKNANKPGLAKKVDIVSQKSDSLGYDVLSYETDETKRYIEVKATRSSVGLTNFYLTANELLKAQQSDNYFIYLVYNVASKTPKVWPIKNPFNPENKNVKKTPVNFRVTINASK